MPSDPSDETCYKHGISAYSPSDRRVLWDIRKKERELRDELKKRVIEHNHENPLSTSELENLKKTGFVARALLTPNERINVLNHILEDTARLEAKPLDYFILDPKDEGAFHRQTIPRGFGGIPEAEPLPDQDAKGLGSIQDAFTGDAIMSEYPSIESIEKELLEAEFHYNSLLDEKNTGCTSMLGQPMSGRGGIPLAYSDEYKFDLQRAKEKYDLLRGMLERGTEATRSSHMTGRSKDKQYDKAPIKRTKVEVIGSEVGQEAEALYAAIAKQLKDPGPPITKAQQAEIYGALKYVLPEQPYLKHLSNIEIPSHLCALKMSNPRKNFIEKMIQFVAKKHGYKLNLDEAGALYSKEK
jgi:hypothetical protein